GRDAPLRQRLRATQRRLMRESPLCDGPGLARTLEDAFEAMFDAAQAGASAAGELARSAPSQKSPGNVARIITPTSDKLHLGCGRRYIPGYFHIDLLEAPHVDLRHRVDVLPFADSSIGLIYASHLLEHFGRNEVEGVLREWHRVMRPGGLLRLAVPDFAAVVAMYASEGLRDGKSGLVGLISGGQRDMYDFHKIIFDEPFLTFLLQKTGFRNVRRWDWRCTEHADVDDYSQAYLPHLDKEHGQLMSLNLEADK
ncbi:MAG: class I SAM-dependent methyltransferase, partial [Pirellulaceae bacterium]